MSDTKQPELPERRSSIRAEVAAGFVDGVKLLAADKELTKKFWRGGFEEFTEHSANGASQWIGKRVVTWLIGVVVMAGIAYLVKSGALK